MKRAISQPAAREKETGAETRSSSDKAVVDRLMSLLKAGADTRTDKVKRIRQSLRTRSYENDLKLSVALDRMTQDLSA